MSENCRSTCGRAPSSAAVIRYLSALLTPQEEVRSQHALGQQPAAGGAARRVPVRRLATRVTDDRSAAQVVLVRALQGVTE